MIYMKNTYLKFDTIAMGDNLVNNITNLILLPDIPEKFYTESYLNKITIENDQLPEKISFELWGSTDYWDLLMKFNGIESIMDFPANYDVILERAEAQYYKWLEEYMLRSDLFRISDAELLIASDIEKLKIEHNYSEKTEEIFEVYNNILDEVNIKNERYREIKYVSISDLSELISNLKELSGKVKLNDDIVVRV